MRRIRWWFKRHEHWLMFICWYRGHHKLYEERGGGSDIDRCLTCGDAKMLRLYGYGIVPDTIIENPRWHRLDILP